jgi:hypothetical protein
MQVMWMVLITLLLACCGVLGLALALHVAAWARRLTRRRPTFGDSSTWLVHHRYSTASGFVATSAGKPSSSTWSILQRRSCHAQDSS